jgi:phage terminase large subunit-like protein
MLCDLVERVFQTEDIRVDEAQLEKYLSYQKYFPFKLFEWEKFCFALHNCTYRSDGTLRFPILVLYVGRGTGKNGYLSFEDFCLLTPTNGVKEYHIDIFATSEDQAKMSWEDVYNILEDNKDKMKHHFRWNKEEIVNLKTGSKFRYRTSASKTKDGGRPGKVDFDELHAYEDYKLIDVATTGLGKKPFPRRTFMSTDGFVREGPLDKLIDKCEQILTGDIPDNGTLPFLCRLDDDTEVDTPAMWHKANPSLRYLPHTLQEIEQEYFDYTLNPTDNASFMVKRMNRPLKQMEGAIAPDDQIRATNQEILEELLIGRPCVAGVDYMLTTDFLGAGLLYRVNGRDFWITHTWVCRESPDLKRIKAPLDKWAERGLLTFVDAPQISPVLPAVWLATEAAKRQSVILKIGIDSFRYDLLKNALLEINFSADKEYGNVQLLRGSDEMRHVPSITSGFTSQTLIWGDNPLMRWAANNSKIIVNKQGNMIYGKIEPKSRKTDPFKAFVMAECVSDVLDPYDNGAASLPDDVDGVFVY